MTIASVTYWRHDVRIKQSLDLLFYEYEYYLHLIVWLLCVIYC